MSRPDGSVLTISEWLDAHRDQLVDLARRLVRIPSQNGIENERDIADVLVEVLRAKGLGTIDVSGPSPDRPSIIATLVGTGDGPCLLLNGHTDTKPAGPLEAWAHGPFDADVADGCLYGLGSADMKSAVAALVFAVQALDELDVDWPGRIKLVLCADEEGGGQYGLEWLVAQGLRADAALIAEPSGIDRSMDTLALGCRGVFRFYLTFKGTPMHSSMAGRRRAVNASEKMARVLCAMVDRFRLTYRDDPLFPDRLTYNIGSLVSGGTGMGIVSGHASFYVDVRTLPTMSGDEAIAELRAFVDQLRAEDPDLDVELHDIRGDGMWLPGARIDASHPLVQSLQWAIASVPGDPIEPGGFPACTDARYLEAVGVPTVVALGPGRIEHCHNPLEHVPLDDILRAAKIYALGAYRYLTHDPSSTASLNPDT